MPAANAKLQDLTYTRNLAGMITRVSSSTGSVADDQARSWTYGCDSLDRLITADNDSGTVEDRSYRYDIDVAASRR